MSRRQEQKRLQKLAKTGESAPAPGDASKAGSGGNDLTPHPGRSRSARITAPAAAVSTDLAFLACQDH